LSVSINRRCKGIVTFWPVFEVERVNIFLSKFISRSWEGRDINIDASILRCFDMRFFASRAANDNYDPVHSTEYDSSGFYGRPELFYLVGGFSYDINVVDDKVVVDAVDVYDWHHMRNYNGDTRYFVSPLPFKLEWSKFGGMFMVLNTIIGCTAFSESFDGTVGISNCLWDWMGEFQDKGVFTSVMRWEFDVYEFDVMYNDYKNRREDDEYDEYDDNNYNDEEN
jgi:hypothetical protein